MDRQTDGCTRKTRNAVY